MPAAFPAQAMILAAGKGTRLKPLTDDTPKCMLPIAGKPLLEHTIAHLRRCGVANLMINVHHLSQTLMDYFGDGSRLGVKISYSQENTLLGTAGGVKNVAAFFKGTFFVVYGDNLSTCSLKKLHKFHADKNSMLTVALHYREDPTQSGIVETDEEGRIIRFFEKPAPAQIFSRWVSAGILVVEPQVLDLIPQNAACDFARDIFPNLLNGGYPLYGYRMSSDSAALKEELWWIDNPADLERARREWSSPQAV